MGLKTLKNGSIFVKKKVFKLDYQVGLINKSNIAYEIDNNIFGFKPIIQQFTVIDYIARNIY